VGRSAVLEQQFVGLDVSQAETAVRVVDASGVHAPSRRPSETWGRTKPEVIAALNFPHRLGLHPIGYPANTRQAPRFRTVSTDDIVNEVLTDALAWRHSDLSMLAQDPKFATAIYRAAIDNRIMDRVAYT
jgi:hypothetical protein